MENEVISACELIKVGVISLNWEEFDWNILTRVVDKLFANNFRLYVQFELVKVTREMNDFSIT